MRHRRPHEADFFLHRRSKVEPATLKLSRFQKDTSGYIQKQTGELQKLSCLFLQMTHSEEPFYFLLPHTCLKLQARHTCADSHLSYCPSVEGEKNDSLSTSQYCFIQTAGSAVSGKHRNSMTRGHTKIRLSYLTRHTPPSYVLSHIC